MFNITFALLASSSNITKTLNRYIGLFLFLCFYSTQSSAGQISLAWDPVDSSAVGGYYVYYGQSSHNYTANIDVGKKTSYTISGLEEGKTYYFATKAYDADKTIESDFSNEVKVVISATPTPQTSTKLSLIDSATNQDTGMVIQQGSRFYIDEPGIKQFNLALDSYPAATRSVRLTLNGAIHSSRVESSKPYAVFGDSKGNYYGKTLVAGEYSLQVKTYDQASAKGNVLSDNTISFSILPVSPLNADFSASTTNGTTPLLTHFSDTSTGSNHTCNWDFGDGKHGDSCTVLKSYSVPGIYTVSLTITDSAGNSSTKTKTNFITVEAPELPPVSNFSAAPRSGEAPLTVNFSNASTDTATKWSWIFGDGATSTSQNPTHTYTEAGTYAVTLTVTGSGGSNTKTQTGYITVTAPERDSVKLSLIDSATNQDTGMVIQQGSRFYIDEPGIKQFNLALDSYPAATRSVRLTLNGAIHSSRVESSKPYAVFGDSKGNYYGKTLVAGEYSLQVKTYDQASAKGNVLSDNTISFSILPGSESVTLEAGKVKVDNHWLRVSFKKTFVDPVVVANAPSSSDGQPVVVRIRNIDSSGFSIRLQDWDYMNDSHTAETVGYLVMERGTHTLSDGTQIEAGQINGNTEYQAVSFEQPFQVSPVMLATVASFNESDTVAIRLNDIDTNGFIADLQEQEANRQTHAMETINYIAWEPSIGIAGGVAFEIERTDNVVSHQPVNITFMTPFNESPVLLANMQTRNGRNTANVRHDSMDIYGVNVLISEEQSKDSEMWHPNEVVGYMVFSTLD